VEAPTKLGGVTLTVGGSAAFIDYVGLNQVNAQVPMNVGMDQQPVILYTELGTTPTYSLSISTAEAGLFTPPSFNIGGNNT
jgi:uncharacterized protein (TIGR03437 family)